jgi:hypothetical protein
VRLESLDSLESLLLLLLLILLLRLLRFLLLLLLILLSIIKSSCTQEESEIDSLTFRTDSQFHSGTIQRLLYLSKL